MNEFQQLEQSAIGQFVGINGINYLVLPDGRIMEQGGDTIYSSGVAQQLGLDLENYKVQGENPPNAGITALPQAQEQGQIVKDADTSFGDVQTHFDQNQMLKEAVSRGDITPEQYNELGGYDVTQTIAGGNPLLGGIANLIGSVPYNIYQSIKGDQPFSDIPGDVYRNVKGGLGIISPELKNKYNQFVQQMNPTVSKNIQQTISNYNPIQQQRYMQFATENPERAQAAAQQAQEFAMARKR